MVYSFLRGRIMHVNLLRMALICQNPGPSGGVPPRELSSAICYFVLRLRVLKRRKLTMERTKNETKLIGQIKLLKRSRNYGEL